MGNTKKTLYDHLFSENSLLVIQKILKRNKRPSNVFGADIEMNDFLLYLCDAWAKRPGIVKRISSGEIKSNGTPFETEAYKNALRDYLEVKSKSPELVPFSDPVEYDFSSIDKNNLSELTGEVSKAPTFKTSVSLIEKMIFPIPASNIMNLTCIELRDASSHSMMWSQELFPGELRPTLQPSGVLNDIQYIPMFLDRGADARKDPVAALKKRLDRHSKDGKMRKPSDFSEPDQVREYISALSSSGTVDFGINYDGNSLIELPSLQAGVTVLLLSLNNPAVGRTYLISFLVPNRFDPNELFPGNIKSDQCTIFGSIPLGKYRLFVFSVDRAEYLKRLMEWTENVMHHPFWSLDPSLFEYRLVELNATDTRFSYWKEKPQRDYFQKSISGWLGLFDAILLTGQQRNGLFNKDVLHFLDRLFDSVSRKTQREIWETLSFEADKKALDKQYG